MLREESLVKIIGHPDSREPEFCDFKKITTLKNSIQTIRERWLGLSNTDKKYYEFQKAGVFYEYVFESEVYSFEIVAVCSAIHHYDDVYVVVYDH